jgi:hypothetical protein
MVLPAKAICMKKTIFTIITLLFFSCFFISCDKETEINNPLDLGNTQPVTANAQIVDGGAPAVDGCGWLVNVSNQYLKADNLPDVYKVHNLAVTITYNPLNSFYRCGLLPQSYGNIEIVSIRIR